MNNYYVKRKDIPVKRALIIIIALFLVLLTIAGGCSQNQAEKTITAFCGSASKPAMEEAAAAFEAETGIKVYLNFSGSGTMLSQMKISKTGDLYIPGSPDYMVIAEEDGVIDPATVAIVAYLVPAIDVQKGNPKNIQGLEDLTRPGVTIGLGNPDTVCLGLYAVEMLDYNGMLEDVGKNVVTYAESCSKTASLIALKSVDAVIGWEVFSSWNPDAIETVFLKPEQVPRLAYIPAAVSTYTADKESSQRFVDFLASEKGKEIFSKWGYIVKESEVRNYAPDAQIGGEYKLPDYYKPLAN